MTSLQEERVCEFNTEPVVVTNLYQDGSANAEPSCLGFTPNVCIDIERNTKSIFYKKVSFGITPSESGSFTERDKETIKLSEQCAQKLGQNMCAFCINFKHPTEVDG